MLRIDGDVAKAAGRALRREVEAHGHGVVGVPVRLVRRRGERDHLRPRRQRELHDFRVIGREELEELG